MKGAYFDTYFVDLFSGLYAQYKYTYNKEQTSSSEM